MNAGNDRRRPTRSPRLRTLVLATSGACVALGSGVAAGSGGGIGLSDPPKVTDVTCKERCLDVRTVTETGKIELTGHHLDATSAVRFKGADGKISVDPKSVSEDSVTAKVPKGAVTGKPGVVTDYGAKASSPVKVEVKPEDAISGTDHFRVKRADATPPKTYFNGRRESELDYLFAADGPTDVRVDVVERKSGKVVDSMVKRHQSPFANHSVGWDGLVRGHKVAPNGKYRFKVSALAGGARKGAGFSYYDHIFPLRAKHTYGDGLGAGRGHQGQDVFAKCGTRIVAARGGRVQTAAYQSAAGYYVVIDGAKTGKDYVYMHMKKKGRPKEGSRVRTGDPIGRESDTGDASGCHLHFELWSAPGWYEGGHVLNPTRPLKAWDKYS